MEENEFTSIYSLSDLAYDKFDELNEAGAFSDLEAEMRKIAAVLPERYSVSLDLKLTVFDSEREKSLDLLTTGITVNGGGEPYRAQSDSTVHRYVVDGHIRLAPHDHCPNCWGLWDFKLMQRTCRECGYVLGDQVKLLLDKDVCPNCEEGKVTRENPACPRCSFIVDTDTVVWG